MANKKQFAIGLALLIATLWINQSTASTTNQWSFAFLADSRDLSGSVGVYTQGLLAIAQHIASKNPNLVLVGGDLINGSGSASVPKQYTNWFWAMQPIYNAGIPVYPVRGNHELNGDPTAVYWQRYIGTNLPQNGPVGEVGMTYSFCTNDALIVGLDEYVTYYRINYSWFTNQLATNSYSHLFVFGHAPAFAAQHSSTLALYPADRDRFWSAIGSVHGRIYLCGHDHFYNRATAIDTNNCQIRQEIVGSAAEGLSTWSGVYPEANRISLEHSDCIHRGYLFVEVSNAVVRATFYGFTNVATTNWVAVDTFSYGNATTNKNITPAILYLLEGTNELGSTNLP